MSEYSVGSGAGSVSSQIRCSHVPCGNFTTRPSALEPWTATAGTATAGTATTVSLSHGTTVASVLTGSSDGRSVTTLRRSPRKRTPVSPSRDSSPKKKKTKPSSSSTTSSRKKGGGADKASSKDLASQGPATRSGASKKKPSAAAGTAPAGTATAGTARQLVLVGVRP